MLDARDGGLPQEHVLTSPCSGWIDLVRQTDTDAAFFIGPEVNGPPPILATVSSTLTMAYDLAGGFGRSNGKGGAKEEDMATAAQAQKDSHRGIDKLRQEARNQSVWAGVTLGAAILLGAAAIGLSLHWFA